MKKLNKDHKWWNYFLLHPFLIRDAAMAILCLVMGVFVFFIQFRNAIIPTWAWACLFFLFSGVKIMRIYTFIQRSHHEE